MIRIKELREERGIPQKQLAIDLHVSQPTVSDWESGKKTPSAKNTKRIADYFSVSIDYLLGYEIAEELNIPYEWIDKYFNAPETLPPELKGKIERVSQLLLKEKTRLEQTKKAPSTQDDALLALFHQLNDEGREKAMDNLDDLVQSGKYKKSDPAQLGQEA